MAPAVSAGAASFPAVSGRGGTMSSAPWLARIDSGPFYCQYSRMDDEPYTLTELSQAAGVTPRTVRYYVSQGLLPSPGQGPAARYGIGHLARLRAIKRLQRDHLPLAEIRRRLARLTDSDVAALGADALAPVGPPVNTTAIDYIRGLLDGRGAPPRRVADMPSFPPLAGLTADARPGAPLPPPAVPHYLAARFEPVPSERSAKPVVRGPQRSQWDRIALNPDVELHIRRPLSRLGNRQVERLLAYARDLFEEDQP